MGARAIHTRVLTGEAGATRKSTELARLQERICSKCTTSYHARRRRVGDATVNCYATTTRGVGYATVNCYATVTDGASAGRRQSCVPGRWNVAATSGTAPPPPFPPLPAPPPRLPVALWLTRVSAVSAPPPTAPSASLALGSSPPLLAHDYWLLPPPGTLPSDPTRWRWSRRLFCGSGGSSHRYWARAWAAGGKAGQWACGKVERGSWQVGRGRGRCGRRGTTTTRGGVP